jgi:hypothetical protein
MAYDQSDVEVVYRRGDWHSWADIVRWFEKQLRTSKQADNEFSAQESQQLLEGFKRLNERGEKFTNDPEKAFRALQSVR